MSSTTTRLGLYKPDGTENVNRTTDINNNWDNIDGKMGFVPLTSSTHPASAYQGEAIYETDTLKAYVNSSAVASAATYKQVLMQDADWDDNITIPSSANQILIGGSTSSASIGILRPSTTSTALGFGVIGEASTRFFVTGSGTHTWGGGTSGVDTNLYRSAADTLKTDDAFIIGGTLNVTGDTTLGGDLTVSTGNLVIGSATFRNNLSTASTVSNTTTETAIAAWNIPANDVVVGAVYRIKAWGTLTVTGTPTITFRGKVGGTTMVSVPAITVRSGATDGQWRIEYIIAVTATGAGGAAAPMMEVQHNFLTSATTWTALGPATAAPVSRDFSVLASHHITAQWSAASASNTIVCRGFAAERVA